VREWFSHALSLELGMCGRWTKANREQPIQIGKNEGALALFERR